MNKHNEKILIVEDDLKIMNFISYALRNAGFPYTTASHAQQALNILIAERIDIMILDLSLPDFDGMEVLKKVREWSEMPIIVVSARDQDKEKVLALDGGADDYLTKPFSATELMARMRVAIRHLHQRGNSILQVVLTVGDLEINFDKRLVYLNSEEVHITPLEYRLLSLFFKNIGKVLTTAYIIKEVWGVGYGTDTQALRTLMAGLRRKIEKNPSNPRYIMTEIGIGYRLVEE